MANDTSIGFNNPFIALRHKNFRLYWIGMCISLIGTWMQNIAQPWLAYSLTDSPLLLSLVGVLQFLPMLLFSLFAGVIIDRFSRKKILLVTQSASLVVTLALAILVWLGHVQYWHILVAATALGFVNTLDMPTRQAFVIEMVGKEDLMNAIALNSSVFNIARILGPALAGLVMSFFGIAACFYINSISFLSVILVLFFINPLSIQVTHNMRDSLMENIKDGLRYIKNNDLIFKMILTVLIVGTFSMNFSVLVPVFTNVVLNQGESGFGFLMSFMGVGSFIGAIFVATFSRSGPKSFILYSFPFFIAAFLIFTGFTHSFVFAALGLAATGFFFVSFSTTANTIVQFNTEDRYRGRVMSVYTLVFGGSVPIGNLFSGLITDYFGPSVGFIVCGVMVFLSLILLLAMFKFHHPKTNYENQNETKP